MRKFRVVYYRGGTSKGCIFHKSDLPENRAEWDEIFLKVMGSPDPKQIDGLGGTVSSNNKIVVVWKSELENVDLEYLTAQVMVGKNQVEYKSNCENMTAAVAPFALEEGLVSPNFPKTSLRLLNKNTDKIITAILPIDPKTKTFTNDGDFKIDGIDRKSAEILIEFNDPGGAKTGKLLPSGNLIDELEIPNFGKINVLIVDVVNPLVLVKAKDLRLSGAELPSEINANRQILELIEKIRAAASVKIGFAKNFDDAKVNFPGLPKIAIFNEPIDFTDIGGNLVKAAQSDICIRAISSFVAHKACPISAACAIGVAMKLGSDLLPKTISKGENSIRIAHPSGVSLVKVNYENKNGKIFINGVLVQRTARRIMDGFVYI